MGGISERLYERPRSVDGGDSLNGGYEAIMVDVSREISLAIFFFFLSCGLKRGGGGRMFKDGSGEDEVV